MRLVWWGRVMATVAALCGLGGAVAPEVNHPAGRWLDDQGHPHRIEASNVAPTVITMAYGACRRVCSASPRMMEELQRLADARRLNLNFVAFDRPVESLLP